MHWSCDIMWCSSVQMCTWSIDPQCEQHMQGLHGSIVHNYNRHSWKMEARVVWKNHTWLYIHIYTHACMHTYIHTYLHTYIHTYMHTYIHTFMHNDGHVSCEHKRETVIIIKVKNDYWKMTVHIWEWWLLKLIWLDGPCRSTHSESSDQRIHVAVEPWDWVSDHKISQVFNL